VIWEMLPDCVCVFVDEFLFWRGAMGTPRTRLQLGKGEGRVKEAAMAPRLSPRRRISSTILAVESQRTAQPKQCQNDIANIGGIARVVGAGTRKWWQRGRKKKLTSDESIKEQVVDSLRMT